MRRSAYPRCHFCQRLGRSASARREELYARIAHPDAYRRGALTVAVPSTPLVKRVLVASPRGYCAGVERAVETVEQALELWGPPVYVRRQIVHNAHVVADLEQRGASLRGLRRRRPGRRGRRFLGPRRRAYRLHERARSKGLRTIDATCPLVTKVHSEVRAYAQLGYTIVFVGHAGHDEVEGTMGEAPDAMVLVQSVEDARCIQIQAERLAYVTQTTLSVDETEEIIATLQRRFPHIERPKKEDICYATTNRQQAVKALLAEVDLVLVIGSSNSSNSNRLVEVARAGGVPAYLIEDESGISDAWLEGVETVGLTSGASAPEQLVQRVCAWFRENEASTIVFQTAVEEDVFFKLPLARAAARLCRWPSRPRWPI